MQWLLENGPSRFMPVQFCQIVSPVALFRCVLVETVS